MTDIFTPNNTEWEDSIDEQGHEYRFLRFTGDMDELCEEYNITEDKAYELLAEYEEISKQELEDVRDFINIYNSPK